MKQSMPAPRRASRKAFTLVELLIVIAIIALLAGILFPVFAKVREGGRKVACNSNLHQLGLAFAQYTTDYGGRYPGSGPYQSLAGVNSWGPTGGGVGNGGNWVAGVDKEGLTEIYRRAQSECRRRRSFSLHQSGIHLFLPIRCQWK